MLTITIGLKCVIAILVLIAFFYWIGKLAFKLNQRFCFQNQLERFYWCTLSGMLMAISIYAIALTHFKTIFLLLPLLLLFFIRHYKCEGKTTPKTSRLILPWVIAGVVIYLSFFLQGFLTFDAQQIKYTGGDYLYYARLAEYLNATSVEASTPEYLYQQSWTVMPYHYGDIWCCALIARVFHIPPSFALALVLYPILSILSCAGLAGYVLKRYKIAWSNWLYLLLLLVFFSGFTSLLPRFANSLSDFEVPPANYPKTLWVLCFIVGSFYLLSPKNFNSLLVFTCIAGISFINLFPALVLAAIFLIVISKKKYGVTWKQLSLGALALMATVFYYFLFYKYQMRQTQSTLLPGQDSISGLSFSQFSKAFAYQVYNRKNHVLILLPIVLLLAGSVLMNKNWRMIAKNILTSRELLWSVCLMLFGFFVWMMTSTLTYESLQFYRNILLPIIAIDIAIVVTWCLTKQQNAFIKAIAVIMVILIVIRNYQFNPDVESFDKTTLNKITNFVKPSKQVLFVYYSNPSELDSIHKLNTRLVYPFPILNYVYHPYIIESLNTPFLLADTSLHYSGAERASLRQSSFYQYSLQNANQLKGLTEEDITLRFIDSFRAQYLVAPMGYNLSPKLRDRIIDSIVVKGYVISRLW